MQILRGLVTESEIRTPFVTLIDGPLLVMTFFDRSNVIVLFFARGFQSTPLLIAYARHWQINVNVGIHDGMMKHALQANARACLFFVGTAKLANTTRINLAELEFNMSNWRLAATASREFSLPKVECQSSFQETNVFWNLPSVCQTYCVDMGNTHAWHCYTNYAVFIVRIFYYDSDTLISVFFFI